MVTEVAEQDLNDIVDYLNGFSPEIGTRYYRLIKKELYKILDMPFSYSMVRNKRLRKLGYRWTVVRNYIIFFVPNNDTKIVSIKRIMYARRDFDALL